MAVFKNEAKKTWTVKFYYTTYDGKRKQKKKEGFQTKAAALDFQTTFLNNLKTSPEITVANLYEHYAKYTQARLRKSTYESKDSVYRTKILPYFGDVAIGNVTSNMVENWQTQLMLDENRYSPTYLKNIHNQLSALFNYGIRFYGLQNNPARDCGSMGKKDADTKQIWTKEEFDLFLEHVSDKPMARVMFSLLFYGGMRSGELLALTAEDFSFTENCVRINKSYTKIKGEDIISEPKTNGSKRIVTLPQPVMDMVAAYIASLYDYNPDCRLFPVTKKYLNNVMRRGCQKSGVKKIRVHDLRHSHASLIINTMHVPILLLQERLGHTDIKTTLGTYGHLYAEQHHELANMLTELMKK